MCRSHPEDTHTAWVQHETTKWAQTAARSVSLHELDRVVRPSRSVTVQVAIRDQNGVSRRFQDVGASTGRALHDTMSSASIRVRGKISPNLVTPRSREIERDRVVQ